MSPTLQQSREVQDPKQKRSLKTKKERSRKSRPRISASLHSILNEFELCLNLSAGLSKRELLLLLSRCNNIIEKQIVT
jgi:hypothetical protein